MIKKVERIGLINWLKRYIILDKQDEIIDAVNGVTGDGGITVPSSTTAALPPAPAAGTIIFDSTTSELKVYDGTAWMVVTVS